MKSCLKNVPISYTQIFLVNAKPKENCNPPIGEDKGM